MTTSPKVDHHGSAARRRDSMSSAFSSLPTNKPLWAPLETDAPITLDTGHEVHVCQLCGCWYETFLGLSNHARHHLREMGISESDTKGNPVEFLHKIVENGELKSFDSKRRDSPAKSSIKRTSMLSIPDLSPSKRLKPSVDFTCVLCGERFENRKGLGSHARSHLRHIGVSDIVGKSSAVEAVQELVSSGMLEPVRLSQTKPATISSTASPPAPSSPTSWARPSASGQPWASQSIGHATTSQSPEGLLNKAPKAKKGLRLAVDPLHRKPKPEPMEMEVFAPPMASSSSPMHRSSAAPESQADPDMQSPPTVLCDYCGQLFETRKALSCHARAHLRQLGVTWSFKSSPLEILRELMMHGEDGKKEELNGASSMSGRNPSAPKKSSDSLPSAAAASSSCASPLDFSVKEKTLPVKDTSCELCGFDFENRKALASHARAHLRQLGIIEWKMDGATSPIELLSELIRKDPLKVSQITHRYRIGDLYIKKRNTVSPSPSTDSDSIAGSSFKSFAQQQPQEHKSVRVDLGSGAGSSRQSQGVARTMAASSARTPRGVHPPKHGTTGQTHQHSNSQQPPRSGGIPALLPKPPLTPLVKLVGKIYSLKCRFCEEVFQGPLTVQEQWITHLQKHILTVGFKGKTSPPATAVSCAALVQPVAV